MGFAFWVDDISIQTSGTDVEVAIYEDDPSFPDTYPTLVVRAIVPFTNIPDTPAIITIPIAGIPLDASRAHGIRLSRSVGSLSDTSFFIVRVNEPGSYAGGYVLYHNGTAWVSTTKDFYFSTELPTSQKTFGLHSDIISFPDIDNFPDGLLWGKARLAAKQDKVLRASLEIITGGDMMENIMPLGKIAVADSWFSGGLVPERITYQITDAGLETSFELGMELPDISKALAWIEFTLARRVDSR